MTKRKRSPVPKLKWSLWMPVALMERLRKRSEELTQARGRRVSVSELVVGAANRSCRNKRTN
jgi:hypothetical protein